MIYGEKLVLDTDKAIRDFLADNAKYEVVVRGQRLIIVDKKHNDDIIEMKFDEDNREEIQTKIEGLCKSLNDGEIILR